ncbi:MAG: hypothetical protein K2I00_01550 [Ruminococcus sp.]|nr:hypothetical protein [Ruminococcus sp.]
MMIAMIIAAVLILTIMCIPNKEKGGKKDKKGTIVWKNTLFMRIVQFFEYICKKIKKFF